MVTIKLKLNSKDIDITTIYANTTRATCYLKRAQVFAISIRDIQYPEPRSILKILYLKNTMIFWILFQKKTQILFLYIENLITRFK